MKVISFINEKGGSCKTTFAVNFSAYFAKQYKKRVLLVDMDSQGHAGKSLGIAVRNLKKTSADLLLHPNQDPSSLIRQTNIENLHLIGGNKSLSTLPETLAQQRNRDLRLLQSMQAIEENGYDYVFLDSPPSAGIVTKNILIASTNIVIPVALTYLALDGCAEIVISLHQVKRQYEKAKPRLTMVIPTLYRKTKLANEIVKKLSMHFPKEVSKTILGFNVQIDEAQSYGKTIWEYAPQSKGAKMMATLSKELMQRSKQ